MIVPSAGGPFTPEMLVTVLRDWWLIGNAPIHPDSLLAETPNGNVLTAKRCVELAINEIQRREKEVTR